MAKKETNQTRYRINKGRFALSLVVFTLLILWIGRGLNTLGERWGRDEPASRQNPVEATFEPVSTEVAGQAGRVVVIDAGHGGFDCGAVGVSGSHEDQLNLQVAQALRRELEDAGITVLMTRDDENALAGNKNDDMARRRQIIEGSGSDIVISIHMNALENDSSLSGYLVYHLSGSSGGEALAGAIDGGLTDLGEQDIKSLGVRDKELYILRSGSQPCVLVECGFLSNPREERLLGRGDHQRALARGICAGILDYLEQ